MDNIDLVHTYNPGRAELPTDVGLMYTTLGSERVYLVPVASET